MNTVRITEPTEACKGVHLGTDRRDGIRVYIRICNIGNISAVTKFEGELEILQEKSHQS